MIQVLKKLVRSVFPKNYNKSYSQEGEDMLLRRIFHNKKKGFFIDIGAYHPVQYSNTYYFYQKGWRGINIDARPGSMAMFKQKRPADINLEIPLSGKKQVLKYFAFYEPALNTFVEEIANERKALGNKIKSITELETWPLSEVVEKHLPNIEIDFISMDVEGLEIEILKSNNWNKCKPELFLIEQLNMNSVEELAGTEVAQFMRTQGYLPFAKLKNTVFYRRPNSTPLD